MFNYIICLVGKSGSGKSTIANEFCKSYGCKQIQSLTTRPQRCAGEEGHVFVTQDEFDAVRDDLVAYTKFNGYEYGTTQQQIDDCELYVIDVKGIEYLKKTYNGGKKIAVVYVASPPFTNVFRMLKRGDSIKSVVSRVINDRKEFKNADSIGNYVIYNDNLENSVKDLKWLFDLCNMGLQFSNNSKSMELQLSSGNKVVYK